MRSVDNLIAHAAADMTVTVQAGITVSRLQEILAEKRQHLPIDVPRPERTTIGGLIATNLCGSRCFSRGTVRDLLLGIAVVGAGGALIRGGGRVVKNVAGYDLCKLYAGSWGWLGVIVEATLRVAAMPEASAAIAIGFDSASAIESTCATILAGPLRPTTIDLTASDRLRLIVGFDGPREDVVWQTQQMRRDFADAQELDAAGYAAFRQGAADLMSPAADDLGAVLKLSVRSSDTAALVSQIGAIAPGARVNAHVGNGIIVVRVEGGSIKAAAAITSRAAELGGGWLVLHDAARLSEAGIPMLGPPRPDWKLMRQIKQTLDPAGIFATGSPFDLAIRSAPLVR